MMWTYNKHELGRERTWGTCGTRKELKTSNDGKQGVSEMLINPEQLLHAEYPAFISRIILAVKKNTFGFKGSV